MGARVVTGERYDRLDVGTGAERGDWADEPGVGRDAHAAPRHTAGDAGGTGSGRARARSSERPSARRGAHAAVTEAAACLRDPSGTTGARATRASGTDRR